VRSVLTFNRGWLYSPQDVPYAAADSDFQRVNLPHTNIELPHHNFDNFDYQFISTYRKRFTLPEPLNGRRLFIDFDGAMTAAEVWLNGHALGDHEGGYTPFSFDLTPYLIEGENVLQVRLDSTERKDIPPNGYVVDYLTFGGIYRDVSLRYVAPVYVSDVFVQPRDVLTAPRAEIALTVTNTTDQPHTITLNASIAAFYPATAELTVPAHQSLTHTLTISAPEAQLWGIDSPTLYTCAVDLRGDTVQDSLTARFGFREAKFTPEGFFLNGERLKLRGLNRHQNYAYIGYAAPARLQRKDAEILKHELGLNIARTSHYPQSPHFLDRADEIGLLIFEEIPGWQFIGDADWKGLSLHNIEAMILRDRNHPSIILWGVRINESWDDEGLYTASNALAHQLDSTRQTGGVRNFPSSQFLEDVFTYNDFSYGIIEAPQLPFLVTEFHGHMYPTKSYDPEERQMEHARKHADVQNISYGRNEVSGAIGWCAFDYNTHREFGAGDRICYHGVSDIFRLPKFAADFYASQVDPSVRPFLQATTFYTFGERTAAGVDPFYVFSNVESVEVYKGDDLWGTYAPCVEEFAHLPHPPFKVTGIGLLEVVGHNYQDLRIVGKIGGEIVIEQKISSRGVPHAFTFTADDTVLDADGADMTRLVFRVVDEFGNRLPYCTCVVSFEIEGEGTLVGENPFPLVGGHAAIYVRAGESAGTIRVTAKSTISTLQPAEVTIAVG
jgi:beta-galactosidase